MTKRCVKCHQQRPIDDFYKNGRGDARWDCKACTRRAEKERRMARIEAEAAGEAPTYHAHCLRCGAEFTTTSTRKVFCSSACKDDRAHRVGTSEKALYLAVMARCPTCEVWGPKARLDEHLQVEHA